MKQGSKLALVLAATWLSIVFGAEAGLCARVAVIDFESIGDDPTIGRGVTEIVRTELIKTGKYEVVERALLNKVLEEQKFQLSDLVDPSKAVELGRMLGADLILTGSVVKIGTSYTINARFIDVRTGAAKKAEAIRGNEINELTYMSSQLISILEQEVGAPAAPGPPAQPRPQVQKPPQVMFVPVPTAVPMQARPPMKGYISFSGGAASFLMEELNDVIESVFWGEVEPIESGLNLEFSGVLMANQTFGIGLSTCFLRGVSSWEYGGSYRLAPAKTLDLTSVEIKTTGTSFALRTIFRGQLNENVALGLGADLGVIALKYSTAFEDTWGGTTESEATGTGGLFGVFLNTQISLGSSLYLGGDLGFRRAKGDVELDTGGTGELDLSGGYVLGTAGLRF